MDDLCQLLATIRYGHIPSVGLMISAVILAICIPITVVLSRPNSRHKSWRQWAAVIASQLTTLFLADQMRYPSVHLLGAMSICLAFGFGYSLSAMRGPSLSAGIIAIYISAIYIYGIGLSWLRLLNTVLSENKRSSTFTDRQELLCPLILAICWLIFAGWLMPKLRQKAITALRSSKGQCIACSYNLCGSTDSASCPECGQTLDWKQITIEERA